MYVILTKNYCNYYIHITNIFSNIFFLIFFFMLTRAPDSALILTKSYCNYNIYITNIFSNFFSNFPFFLFFIFFFTVDLGADSGARVSIDWLGRWVSIDWLGRPSQHWLTRAPDSVHRRPTSFIGAALQFLPKTQQQLHYERS